MSFIHRIVYDPLLVGHSFVQPLNSFVSQVRNAPSKIYDSYSLVKEISKIAKEIITLPITLSLFATGCAFRAAQLVCGPSPQKRALSVTEYNWKNSKCDAVRKIAEQWRTLALKKYKQSENDSIFQDARELSELIAYNLEDRLADHASHKLNFDRVYLCQDKALQIPQGIALTSKSELITKNNYSLGTYIKIKFIVTNPNNIRHDINCREYTRVEGAGTALIYCIAKRVLKENVDGIYLESLYTALEFYLNKGFERVRDKTIKKDVEGLIALRITRENISKRLFGKNTTH